MMNIQIILTSYLLKFMFGENAFQDPFLLSLEIMKKAYNEGLYFISNERTVDALVNEKERNREGNLFVFAGIPSFQDICLSLSALPTIYAAKIKLPYEDLVDFKLENSHGDMILYKRNLTFRPEQIEKVTLDLFLEKDGLVYKEMPNETPIDVTKATHFLLQDIKNYQYAIQNKLHFLEEQLSNFLQTENGLKKIENEENLQLLKEIYEELV